MRWITLELEFSAWTVAVKQPMRRVIPSSRRGRVRGREAVTRGCARVSGDTRARCRSRQKRARTTKRRQNLSRARALSARSLARCRARSRSLALALARARSGGALARRTPHVRCRPLFIVRRRFSPALSPASAPQKREPVVTLDDR